MSRWSLCVGWENGPEWGRKTVSLNLLFFKGLIILSLFFFVRLFHLILNPVVKTNSEVPDQTPRSAASDLGLHCLTLPQMSQSRFYR